MKAIETQYKGYRFRSRLEARWAVFFDALGVKWEYEKEGYDLGDGLLYLPDFWMPEQDCFIEIKGERPNYGECEKAQALAMATQKDVLIFWGPIGEYTDGCAIIFSAGETDADLNVFVDTSYGWHASTEQCGWCRNRPNPRPRWDVVYYESNYIDFSGEETVEAAYNAARSARFEHGESGAF